MSSPHLRSESMLTYTDQIQTVGANYDYYGLGLFFQTLQDPMDKLAKKRAKKKNRAEKEGKKAENADDE